MRRLTQQDDRGVIAITVACLAALMFVLMAFSVDIGSAVAITRSAQNSADALALAKATDCARNVGATNQAPYLTNGQTASTTGCGPGTVTATVSRTKDWTFGKIIGLGDYTKTRSATAKWGTLGVATATFPIAIADCEWSQTILDGTVDITLYIDDPKPQSGCSSVPGGFGQLDRANDSDCTVIITSGEGADGKPGGDLQKAISCITPLPKAVLVPIYDSAACAASGCTGQGPYAITGFAEFVITGYSFNGNKNAGTLDKDCPLRPGETKPTVPKYCIRGDFIRFVADGTPGTSTNFGVTDVYLFS